MLAMERPVSIAEELATERTIRRLNGWCCAAIRMASRAWSALGMAQLNDIHPNHDTVAWTGLQWPVAPVMTTIHLLCYGAAAKGNTLLNYAGIKADLLPAVADRATSKQGKLLPGSHIPVISPEQLAAEPADTLLVLPWNLIEELQQQMPGTELVTVIPKLHHWNGGR